MGESAAALGTHVDRQGNGDHRHGRTRESTGMDEGASLIMKENAVGARGIATG